MSQKQKREVLSVSLDKSQLNSLLTAIQNLIKVYAAAQIKREEGTERNARFLKVFGLTDQEIADLLGVTRQAVSSALKKAKKKTKKTEKELDDTLTKA